MRRTNKGSYVSLEWPGWSGPRLFSLSGVEQGRAEEQCASARQILSPRGNFTWPTAQSTNKASGDKKESLARCRPNFIPSSCGNSTHRLEAGWRWHNGWQGDVALLIGTNFTAVWQFHLPGVGTKEWQGGISSHKLVQRRQSTCYRKNPHSRLYRIYKEMWVNPTVSNIFSHNMITYPIVRAASLSHAFKISFCVAPWSGEDWNGFDGKVKKLGISHQLDELKRVGWIEGPSRELFYWAASCDELCVLPASPLTLLGCYTYGR